MQVGTSNKYLLVWLKYGVVAILVLMPVQAVVVTWLRSLSPRFDLLLAWKEILLAVLCIPVSLLIARDANLKRSLKRSPVVRLILLFTVLHIVLGIIHNSEIVARITGIALNLRFLAFYVMALIVGYYRPVSTQQLLRWLLVPALVVVGFGALQATVLPHDILRHVGYGPDTIRPFSTVNEQRPDLVRINSTLRGPNPLGAYLLVPMCIALALMAKAKKNRDIPSWLIPLIIGLSLITLFATYSRSAWIGLGVAGLVVAVLSARNYQQTKVRAVGGVVIVLALLAFGFRHNHYVQNLIYHTDSSIHQTSSNQQHLTALREGMRDLAQHPFGRGPGVAGPASRRLRILAPSISENYYLQLGQEVGVLGILLFVGIVFLVAVSLWVRRDSALALGLLASLVGLSVVGLFLHVWADEDVAYIWWGLAGFVISRPPKKSAILSSS